MLHFLFSFHTTNKQNTTKRHSATKRFNRFKRFKRKIQNYFLNYYIQGA